MAIHKDTLRFYRQNLEMCAQAREMTPEQLELAILQRKLGLPFNSSFEFGSFETSKPTLRERVNKVTRRISRG